MSGAREVGERIEELLAALTSGASEAPAGAASELARLLVGLYGDGLTRIVALLGGRGEEGAAILSALATDPLVESLLLLHDLHPLDLDARVQRALDRVRPHLGAPAGGVEYLGVTDGVARLRLAGGRHGCPSSMATVRLAIERAVMDAAPEVTEVVVDGMTQPPEPTLLQIGSRPPADEDGGPAAPATRAARPPASWNALWRHGAAKGPAMGSQCEFCAAEILPDHAHVADLDLSSLMCACRACDLLFSHSATTRGRYRAVPRRYLADPAHPLSGGEWDELGVPVGLAFFLRTSRQGNVAGFYPSPAGVTECSLDLAAWQRVATAHPLLNEVEPDVEATLISRTEASVECFCVPIDACYQLAGQMRLLWRGFDGGPAARDAIASFLDDVRARAGTLVPGA